MRICSQLYLYRINRFKERKEAMHVRIWLFVLIMLAREIPESGAFDNDGDNDDFICPNSNVVCNVSLILNGDINDTVAANASTQVKTTDDCTEVNCFCAVQYRIFPLEPYVSVHALNSSMQLNEFRPSIERVDMPLLSFIYNEMQNNIESADSGHQRTMQGQDPMRACVVDTADNLAVGLEENVLGLMLNNADITVENLLQTGHTVKKLFGAKVQVIYNPNELVNNIYFLYDFAVEHLAYNVAFLFIESFVVGVLIWIIERGRPGSDFPYEWSRGVQKGWYWAIITFTTVGYGDNVPKSMYGRIVAVIWAISAVLQSALTTSLLINDLSAYSRASPRDMLFQRTPPATIGVMINTTSSSYASHYTSAGYDGVKLYDNIADACLGLQYGDIQAYVADVNMLNYCFVLWGKEQLSQGFVIGELESARQEIYVAVYQNASKGVFTALFGAIEPTLSDVGADVNNNGDVSTLVAQAFSPSASGVFPLQASNQINWSPILVAALGCLIGLTITALSIPVILLGSYYKNAKGSFIKAKIAGTKDWVEIGKKSKSSDDSLSTGLLSDENDYAGADDIKLGDMTQINEVTSESTHQLLNEQRKELKKMLSRHQEELDDLIGLR